METTHSYNRYQRQVILKEFGVAGQDKLSRASVLVIGAGGLGCPALQYLAAAGVGSIGIVDDDIVALSNLHRQVLFTTNDIGYSKVLKAKDHLQHLNDEITVSAFNERLTVENALRIFSSYDIIVDGSDNFATRYLVNDACVLLNKPLIYGAVSQFEGQVAVFNFNSENENVAVNYRDVFPIPPQAGEVLSCAEAGVLGVLPGIIGTMQANETIKLITGMGTPLVNSLLTYNALTNQVYTVELQPNRNTSTILPANAQEFLRMDYAFTCGNTIPVNEISIGDFEALLHGSNVSVIDVRELDETPEVTTFIHTKIPLGNLRTQIPVIQQDNIVVFCQTGKRSMQAAQWLFDIFGDTKKVFSLQGGILNWLQNKSDHDE
jgi:adenylyltransferase/sulfurtransferase